MPQTLLQETPNVIALRIGGRPRGVNREDGIIHDVILAEEGPFETKGRGEFNAESLEATLSLMQAARNGLKSRWTHPLGSDDGLGKFLGRWQNPYVRGQKLRADLKFSETALQPTPESDGVSYAEYLMNLVDEDPGALECSLHIDELERRFRRDSDGELQKDAEGDPLPPIWIPKSLIACDVVDEGDATHSGFLGIVNPSQRNSSAMVAQATRVLDVLFRNQSRDVVSSRATAFLDRYLSNRFEEPNMSDPQPATGVTKDEVVALVTEQLKPIGDSLTKLTETLTSQAAATQEADRIRQITALCTEVDMADKAADFIADKTLSVDSVRERLWTEMKSRRGLTTDSTPTNPGGNLPPQKRFEKEWDDNSKAFLAVNCSKELYVKHRMIEEGLKPETNPMVTGVVAAGKEPMTAA